MGTRAIDQLADFASNPTLTQRLRQRASAQIQALPQPGQIADVSVSYQRAYLSSASGTYSIYGMVNPQLFDGIWCNQFTNQPFFEDSLVTRINFRSNSMYRGSFDLTTRAINANAAPARAASDSVAYCMEWDTCGRQVEGVIIFPHCRAEAESLHRAAALALTEGAAWSAAKQLVLRLGPEMHIRAAEYSGK